MKVNWRIWVIGAVTGLIVEALLWSYETAIVMLAGATVAFGAALVLALAED